MKHNLLQLSLQNLLVIILIKFHVRIMPMQFSNCDINFLDAVFFTTLVLLFLFIISIFVDTTLCCHVFFFLWTHDHKAKWQHANFHDAPQLFQILLSERINHLSYIPSQPMTEEVTKKDLWHWDLGSSCITDAGRYIIWW